MQLKLSSHILPVEYVQMKKKHISMYLTGHSNTVKHVPCLCRRSIAILNGNASLRTSDGKLLLADTFRWLWTEAFSGKGRASGKKNTHKKNRELAILDFVHPGNQPWNIVPSDEWGKCQNPNPFKIPGRKCFLEIEKCYATCRTRLEIFQKQHPLLDSRYRQDSKRH